MQELTVGTSKNLVTSDVLLALQLRTGNEHPLPRLATFVCTNTTGDLVPLIPLFLSPKTTHICIEFSPNPPMVMVALVITRIPALCPNIQTLIFDPLPRDSAMTEAVSEMLLACNPETLQGFFVACPLTEEAHRVLYTLPNLRHLWAVIRGPTPPPPVVLPNLDFIYVEYDSGRDWLQYFRGATLRGLRAAIFHPAPGSAQIGGFLEEFQSVALTASIQNSLSMFCFYTR